MTSLGPWGAPQAPAVQWGPSVEVPDSADRILATPPLQQPQQQVLQGTPQPSPLPAVPTAARTNGHPRGDRRRDLGLPPDSASTVLSSELESSSFIDSDEDDNTSRWAWAGVQARAGVRVPTSRGRAGCLVSAEP